jgi:glyoxalase family protein
VRIMTPGIHHITAITGDPQRNLDFYEGFLGQRLVKRTVNFDDSRSYHFYFGDSSGTPGTLLTFFYFGKIRQGVSGVGEVNKISYSIRKSAKAFWMARAKEFGVSCVAKTNEFGEDSLELRDFDEIVIELVLSASPPKFPYWNESDVPEECSLQGFHGATLTVVNTEEMKPVLEALGYALEKEAGMHTRFTSTGKHARILDLIEAPDLPFALQGTGSVHHIAFRVADDDAEMAIREKMMGLGIRPTPVIDRQYFHSVYFMTPGRILFEIATDEPGFAIDEAIETLGEKLVLPPQFEPYRADIASKLVPVELPRNKMHGKI